MHSPPHEIKILSVLVKVSWKTENLNGVYSKNHLPNRKNGLFVTSFDEYKSIGTHWITLHVNGDNITYFDSFSV